VHEFWENIVSQRDTTKLFIKGIQISKDLMRVQELISQISSQQSDNDSKVYLKMAQFYSQVVFKNNESLMMIDKARQAF
jgi:hypothetical protein